MKRDDEAGDDLLSDIDLHAWQVPPPVDAHRPDILVRALSPATPPRQRRLVWLVAAAAVMNSVLAVILVIIISRPAPAQPVAVMPAGGGVDPKVEELLGRLDREQRETERKLAEIKELRVALDELASRCNDKTVGPKQPKRSTPPPTPGDQNPVPADPYSDPRPPVPPAPTGCDEVSCVLGNYSGPCCAKFRKGAAPTQPPPASTLPDSLSRVTISEGIAKVKGSVVACAQSSQATGKVKIRVQVAPSGVVSRVTVDVAPDAALGACVAAAIQRAVFEKTQNGGSFSYPFIF